MEDIKKYKKNTVITVSGIFIDVSNITIDNIYLYDIIHALCHESRFNGQSKKIYTVGSHVLNGYNLLKSQNYNNKILLEWLLHDATEAYCKDMPKPIKNLLPDYEKFESKLGSLIAYKYGFKDNTMSPEVKQMDEYMLNLEWNTVFRTNLLKNHSIKKVKKGLIKAFKEVYNHPEMNDEFNFKHELSLKNKKKEKEKFK